MLRTNWNVKIDEDIFYADDTFCAALEELVLDFVKPAMSKMVSLDGLSAVSYQNPTDRSILNTLSNMHGIKTLIGKIADFYKRPRELHLLANQQFVTAHSHPRLYKLYWTAVRILGLKEVPPLFIDSSLPGINAYTTGTDKAYVAISPQCAFLLDERELLFIFGHELGHVQCDHVRYYALADAMLDGVNVVPVIGPIMTSLSMPVIKPLLSAWLRCAEISSDRAGLLCCQSKEAALRTLMKMGGHPWNAYHAIRTRTIIDQAFKFIEETRNSGMDRMFDLFNRLYASHPYLIYRASELILWMQNGEYDEHVHSDAEGRQLLKKRMSGDPAMNILMKEVEKFVVQWHVEQHSLDRKQTARAVRGMLYSQKKPELRPLNVVGQITLEVRQKDANTIEYFAAFTTLNKE